MTAPHNLDAEAAFLGSVLLDTTVLAELDPLAPGDFFDERHAHIWSGIQRLYQAGQPIDYLTVNNELVKLGRENVVPPQYTAQLTERVATAIHAKAYAEIVQDLGKRRRLITAARQIAEAGGDMQVETADAIARAHDVFLQATTTDSLVGPQRLSDIAAEHWEAVENALKGGRRGIPLGFANTLDKAIGGLRPKQLLILAGRPGDGKCLGRGTRLLMHNGDLKNVEDVIPGDHLMGPDSRPRTVLSTTTGKASMYWIRQNHGIDYKVNGAHILSLKRSKNEKLRGNGEVKNISVEGVLDRGRSFLGRWKGYKTKVDWPEKPTPLAPYLLGLWLGDGSASGSRITNPDREIIAYIDAYAAAHGMRVNHQTFNGTKCPTHNLAAIHRKDSGSALRCMLRGSGVLGNKHIPREYLINSAAVRLRLLAGLLDTDGYYNGRSYEIATVLPEMAGQIKFLADSLGFHTSMREKRTTCQNGYEGKAYRIMISGDLTAIPVLVERRKAKPRRMNKDWRMTGIRIEPAGEDEYFGFELDGDGLFLLEDMTVTHNSTITRQIALQVAMRGLPTALFSLETGREEHLACIPHLLTRVDEKLTYTMGECQLLIGARDRMRDIPFYIDDTSPLSVSVLKTKLVQLRAREPSLAMIFVDYLQLMDGAKQREENLDVTPITRGLKQLAMNTGLPIVALSAMNRGIETRGPDAEPMLSDLRWGGEADADIVVFVRRVRQSAVEGMRGARNRAMPARVFIKKNRNGPVDDRFDLTFLAAQKRFEENVNDIA